MSGRRRRRRRRPGRPGSRPRRCSGLAPRSVGWSTPTRWRYRASALAPGPPRLGRNGCAFTRSGRLSLKAARFTEDFAPLDETCPCPSCQGYTRAYVRHLYRSREILAARLVTYHNLHFYLDLMRHARTSILSGTYPDFHAAFIADYSTPSSGG